ncbi:MFS transporter [Asticcacaulis endophyticus]|uniref:MFS transporter n=1 Tax=Asticcacaulis endophyticus TaxID=1395890 RepID=A0A918UYS8_9CAUL|nr:MFS transporter [Asticcacaulis endophyticus]GGZ42879.1 MFS transporter [Asticcacaulis endophyticus]
MNTMGNTGSPAKVGLFEKISYGAGDTGFNFYWTTISAFLMIFYTDVFGISAAAAGTMLLTTKIVDAITDPIMGAIADRTKTRWGKFRPYILWMIIPMIGAGVLTFTTPDLDEGGKLIYAYATFTLLMVIYTAINIPYNALSGVMTPDGQQRSTIISFRFIGGFLGGTIVTYFTPPLVKYLSATFGGGDETVGWQLVMVVYGIIAGLLFLNLFLNTRERVEPLQETNASPLRDIRDLTQNGPWVVLFFLALIIMVTITLRMSTSAYYMKYYIERPDLTGAFLTVYGIALAVGSACTPLLTRFFDKKHILMVLMAIVGVLCVAFYFVPKDQIGLLFALQILIGLTLGPKSPLAYSMYADTADYNEWKTGRRATAMTFSAATFSQKLGGALASFVIGIVFSALGYVANQAQTGASQSGIVMLMTLAPGAVALFAAIVTGFYSLTKHDLDTIQIDLAERKLSSHD